MVTDGLNILLNVKNNPLAMSIRKKYLILFINFFIFYPIFLGNKSQNTKTVAVKNTQNNESGKKTFQPSLINWSYLKRGKVALTHKKTNKSTATFKKNQTNPGIKLKNAVSSGGSHPPKKSIVPKELISIIAEYSPKKNIANNIEEYSVKYPATNADSSSGKSNGALFVSAKADIIKTINIGNNGIKNQQPF